METFQYRIFQGKPKGIRHKAKPKLSVIEMGKERGTIHKIQYKYSTKKNKSFLQGVNEPNGLSRGPLQGCLLVLPRVQQVAEVQPSSHFPGHIQSR